MAGGGGKGGTFSSDLSLHPGSILMLIEQFTQNLSVLVPLLKTAFGCL